MTKNVKIWITSDLHFYHKNILKLSPKTRGHFNDIHDMNEFFIEHWNDTVGPDDIIYYLGDFCFGSKKRCRKLLNRLNGRIYFILGNHDLAHMNVLKEQCESVSFYMTFMYMNTRIVLFHHPIHFWHSMEHGAIHFFGHCVDNNTEILTKDGFKYRSQLSNSDLIGTMNENTNEFEWNNIERIIDNQYTGKVYEFKNRSIDQRVTSEHRIPHNNSRLGSSYKIKTAEELFSEKTKKSRIGLYNTSKPLSTEDSGINLSDEMIKLYMCICADGSIKNETNLVRFCIQKQRKIDYFEGILTALKINYNKYIQNDMKTVSINFYMPNELYGLNIKGMDQYFKNCSLSQFECLLEAIENTDGMKHSRSEGVFYYTSKQSEVDTIQTLAIKHGYMCNVLLTKSGFSNNPAYSVYMIKRKSSTIIFSKNDIKETETYNEHFWCVSVKNRNFFVRRNGKVSLTGNCHGEYHPEGRCIDVGFDNLGAIVDFDYLVQFMLNEPIVARH